MYEGCIAKHASHHALSALQVLTALSSALPQVTNLRLTNLLNPPHNHLWLLAQNTHLFPKLTNLASCDVARIISYGVAFHGHL